MNTIKDSARPKRLLSVLLVILLAFSGAFAVTTSAHAATHGGKTLTQAMTNKPWYYVAMCGNQANWTNKKANDCNGWYTIYDVRTAGGRSPGTVVFKVNNTNYKANKAQYAAMYKSAQAWCSNNSLTCTIGVSIGVAILGALF